METKKFTVIGWFIILLIFYLISKNKTGYNIIYNSLFLIFAFVLVTSYKEIKAIMIKE